MTRKSIYEQANGKRLAAMVAKFFPTPMDALPDAMIQSVGVWKLILRNPTGKSNPPC